jgi:hypothetical protein
MRETCSKEEIKSKKKTRDDMTHPESEKIKLEVSYYKEPSPLGPPVGLGKLPSGHR